MQPGDSADPGADEHAGADGGAGAAGGRDAAAPTPAVPDALRLAVERMAPVVRLLCHEDRGLALFHGSQEGEPALIEAVLSQRGVNARPAKGVRYNGYERVLAGRTLLLLDGGPPPPTGFDRDAHAAPLSFELSVGRERLIVNCGAWPGRTGRGAGWHTALRQTAAHSTLTVDDTSAPPLRPDGGLARLGGRVSVERSELEGGVLLEASHDFYAKAFGLIHRRRLWLAEAGDDLRGEDALATAPGRTPRAAPFALRFHLHPAVEAEAAPAGAILRTAAGTAWRFFAEGGSIAVEESVYIGHEADRRPARQIVVTGTAGGDPEPLIQWALVREDGAAGAGAEEPAEGRGDTDPPGS
jgi:uncharacterized heparinase superfamily protein